MASFWHFPMSALVIFFRKKYWPIIWCDFNTKNEPGNMALVRMNAVSVVVLGGIGFNGIGDLTSDYMIIGSITFRKIPD